MKPKSPSSVRPFGQVSLTSSFLSRSSSRPSKQSISLSDFLDRKLHKADQKSIQEKTSGFVSIGAGGMGLGDKKDELGGELRVDGAIFKQFKPSAKEENRMGIGGSGVEGFESTSHLENPDIFSRKRKNSSGFPSDYDRRSSTPKHVVVLGDDPKGPKPKAKRIAEEFAAKRTKYLYNHYANGNGWWDCDREGIDSDEVGCNEVWEGMGSTTLGGLDWN